MNGIIGSFLAISDTEAKVTILGKDGIAPRSSDFLGKGSGTGRQAEGQRN